MKNFRWYGQYAYVKNGKHLMPEMVGAFKSADVDLLERHSSSVNFGL